MNLNFQNLSCSLLSIAGHRHPASPDWAPVFRYRTGYDVGIFSFRYEDWPAGVLTSADELATSWEWLLHIDKRSERAGYETSMICFTPRRRSSLSRAEGFSCSLGVLYGGLGISKLQILDQKNIFLFSAVHFFQFWVMKPRIRDPDPQIEKMLDPDPYPDPH